MTNNFKLILTIPRVMKRMVCHVCHNKTTTFYYCEVNSKSCTQLYFPNGFVISFDIKKVVDACIAHMGNSSCYDSWCRKGKYYTFFVKIGAFCTFHHVRVSMSVYPDILKYISQTKHLANLVRLTFLFLIHVALYHAYGMLMI